MTKKRIYSSNLNRGAYLPLVWATLRAHVERSQTIQESFEWEEPIFLREQLPAAGEIADADVFLASCYVWNTNRSLSLCATIKNNNPGCFVVVGGPHVPDDAEQFLRAHPYVDLAIHKEGELPLEAVLEQLAVTDEPTLDLVPSASFLRPDGKFATTPPAAVDPTVTEGPGPYLSGHLDHALATAKASGHLPIALWETNRGCPYSCTFCDWGSSTMSRIRTMPIERLFDEIAFFGDHGVEALICCDANFGILPRDYELAERLVQSRHDVGAPSRFITSYAKNARDRVFDIARLFAIEEMSSGAILAMQSTSEDVLSMVKRSNMPAANYAELASRFRSAGVECYTELILGLPGETVDSWVSGLGDVLRMGVHDDVMMYECVLLPNSELSNAESRERHALDTITRSYLIDDVETIEVVVGHSEMSRNDWVYMQLIGMIVQALHGRGLTRYLAEYLDREEILRYEDFYRAVLDRALAEPSTTLGRLVSRVNTLFRTYLVDDSIPNEGKIASQPDMIEPVLAMLPEKENWLPYEWVWVELQADLSALYDEVVDVLERAGVAVDDRVTDLLGFQRGSVSRLDDDALAPKFAILAFDWPSYFAGATSALRSAVTPVSYRARATRLV